MLDIDSGTLDLLREKGALTYDHEGDEVLIGLNTPESNFYLSFGDRVIEIPVSGETILFLQLHRRHVLAKQAKSLVEAQLSRRRPVLRCGRESEIPLDAVSFSASELIGI